MREIDAGDFVAIRDAFGRWHEAVACSKPHLNSSDTFRKSDIPWRVVSVRGPEWEHSINWPVESVVLMESMSEGACDAD